MLFDDIKKTDTNDFNQFMLTDAKNYKLTDYLKGTRQKEMEEKCD